METSVRVASIEILSVECHAIASDTAGRSIHLEFKSLESSAEIRTIVEDGDTLPDAIGRAVSQLCSKSLQIQHVRELARKDGSVQYVVTIQEQGDAAIRSDTSRSGIGRYVSNSQETGIVVACLRAANHAGLLKPEFRSSNQKMLRQCSHELVEELTEVLGLGSVGEQKRLEADSVVLEHLNRVASAAVVTAANAPNQSSVLSLFDTSAWLYDAEGRKRSSFTDTPLWFAWHPGLTESDRIVGDVVDSMPSTPSSQIPWIVRLFENPESWIRFRGAVDLEDHDVLHVLLGRGLQDQDEAFVLGFAMGTAKKVRWWEKAVFPFLMERLYPEPYRIPRFLHAAFRLGVQCGQETGNKNLYRSSLRELRTMTIEEARNQAGIEVPVLRRFYRQEQTAIPITIASLRLP